jgi:type VI secretion system VasI family protein
MIDVTAKVMLLSAALLAAPALAQDNTNPYAQCRDIKPAMERLSCYDGVRAQQDGIDTPLASQLPDTGEWRITNKKHPISGTPDVYLMHSAKSDDETLILRCRENTTDAYITTKSFVAENESKRVRFKVDDGSETRQDWLVATDGLALFAERAIPFIKSIASGNTFVFEYTPFHKGAHIVTFDLTGLNNALKDLRAACHW